MKVLIGRILVVCLAASVALSAQTFKSLVTFNQTDGSSPLYAPPVQGLDGNLYGTTAYGGVNNEGAIFKITPAGRLTTIYSFCSQTNCADGSTPYAGLTLGTNGNFYGTTSAGGANGNGDVFEITPTGKLTVLHSFTGTDGQYPHGGLVLATDRNFYGTTGYGGTSATGAGTVFKISAAGTFTSLYSFTSGADGGQPYGTLVQASNGNFYGTTYGGGGAYGTVFEITSAGKLTPLHSFSIGDGEYPNAGLVQGSNGTLYGTTSFGGATTSSIGTVFQITQAGKFTSLYSFCASGVCSDGSNPQAALVPATDGNLYGLTWTGGTNNDGTVFEITPAGQLTTLHIFNSTDGLNPGALMQATNGTFYGTTAEGGGGQGTVFSLSTGLAPFVQTLPNLGKVGARISILGMGLSGTTAVSFNGTPATFTAYGAKITAAVPAGATSGPITVTTPTGTLTTTAAFRVAPQLTSFAPSNGPVGSQVVLTGVSLTQTSKVTFNGKSATFTVNSDTQVTATVPTGATTGKIVITTPGGTATSSTSFTVN